MITDFGDVGDFERPPLHSGEAVKLWRASKKGPTAAAEDVAKKFFCSVDEVCDAIVTVFTEESRNGPNQRMIDRIVAQGNTSNEYRELLATIFRAHRNHFTEYPQSFDRFVKENT